MSNRVRNRIPPAPPAPPHKVSDKSRLLWERYHGPMQGAAQAMNAAIQNVEQIIAATIIEAEGFSPETHIFNVNGASLTIIPRPQEQGGNGVAERR